MQADQMSRLLWVTIAINMRICLYVRLAGAISRPSKVLTDKDLRI